MNVYLMVDIEGISGIYAREQVLPEEPKFQEGRRFMSADINACMRGLKEAGVSKIYVHDCHGGGYSVLYEEISSDADYIICGQVGNRRFAGIEDCDAAILLGYHAMAGEKGAILEHTMNSKKVQNMLINGKKVGELGIDAGILGDMGKPVIMVSGDFIYNNWRYSKAENIYHVPECVVQICDLMHIEGREVMALFPMELMQYVKQYDSGVCMPYGRNVLVADWNIEHSLYELMEAEVVDATALGEHALQCACVYIVMHKDREMTGNLTDSGYILKATIQDYQIYYNEAGFSVIY